MTKKPIKEKDCKHPPERQYCWTAHNEKMQRILCIVCLDCHLYREIILKIGNNYRASGITRKGISKSKVIRKSKNVNQQIENETA